MEVIKTGWLLEHAGRVSLLLFLSRYMGVVTETAVGLFGLGA